MSSKEKVSGKMSGPYQLLDAIVPPTHLSNTSYSLTKKIGALFVRSDGVTKYVEKKSPHALVTSLFPKSEGNSDLWRDIRPLMDTSETSFHLHVKYDRDNDKDEKMSAHRRHTQLHTNDHSGQPLSPKIDAYHHGRKTTHSPSRSTSPSGPTDEFVPSRPHIPPHFFEQSREPEPVQQPYAAADSHSMKSEGGGDIRWISIRTTFVSALIENDMVLFFHGDNPMFKAFLDEFLSLMPHVTGSFDLFVLDALLAASLKIVKSQLQNLKPMVENATRWEARTIDTSRLFPVSRSVNRLHTSTKTMCNVLKSLVMSPMYTFAGDETREIFNSWYKCCQEIMAGIINEMTEIDEAMEHINASMDQTRNKYMVLEVVFNVLGVALSTGAVVSGIFGMNLESGLTTAPHAFNITVAGILLMGATIVSFSFWYIFRNRATGRYTKITQHSKPYNDEVDILRMIKKFDREENTATVKWGTMLTMDQREEKRRSFPDKHREDKHREDKHHHPRRSSTGRSHSPPRSNHTWGGRSDEDDRYNLDSHLHSSSLMGSQNTTMKILAKHRSATLFFRGGGEQRSGSLLTLGELNDDKSVPGSGPSEDKRAGAEEQHPGPGAS